MLAVAAPTTEEFKREFLEYLRDQRGVLLGYASPNDCYQALAHTVRRRLVQAWIATLEAQLVGRARFVFYLSAEYLLGRQLENALLHTGLGDTARRVLADLGLDLDALAAVEREPGLGNGGLGRLAACFLDSLATLGIPAVGYGIRYEFGMFDQEIKEGWQIEKPDEWLRFGNPWEMPRPEYWVPVGFGGRTQFYFLQNVALTFETNEGPHTELLPKMLTTFGPYTGQHRKRAHVRSVLGRDVLDRYALILDKRAGLVILTDEDLTGPSGVEHLLARPVGEEA